MSSLGEELERLRGGVTTFAAFRASTGADWQRMAGYLYGRWRVPVGVEAVDVEQELLIAAWQSVPAWDPSRGVSLRSFVVWGAMTGAKKWLNVQRNAKRRDGKADGRFPLAFAAYPEGEEPRDPAAADASPEETASAREQLTFVLGERSDVEREVLLAVVASGGDLARAARMVFSDPTLCLRARLGSERDAERFTARVAEDVLGAAVSRGSDER